MSPVFYYVTLGLGAVMLAAFLYVRVKQGGVKAMMLKAATSVLFIMTAVMAVLTRESLSRVQLVFSMLVLMELLFGLLGDIWLDLKYCHRESEKFYTFSGMFSFSIAHIFTLSAIYLSYTYTTVSLIIPVLFGVLFALIVGVMGKPMKLEFGQYKKVSMLYGGILSMAVAASLAACIVTGWASVWVLMLVGTALFLVSDLILSSVYFKEGGNTPVNVIFNHITYYAAQFAIASAIMLI